MAQRNVLFDRNGLMAEWLGKGLQNLVQRFESASDLTKTASGFIPTRFFCCVCMGFVRPGDMTEKKVVFHGVGLKHICSEYLISVFRRRGMDTDYFFTAIYRWLGLVGSGYALSNIFSATI